MANKIGPAAVPATSGARKSGLNRRDFLARSASAVAASAAVPAAAAPGANAAALNDPAAVNAQQPAGEPAAANPAGEQRHKNPRYPSHMRVGLFTWPFNDKPLGWVLDYAQRLKLQMLEIGAGNDPGAAHCPVESLLADASARRRYLKQFADHGLAISALSCHGNPLHPDAKIARARNAVYVRTLRLAELLEVPVVNCFSGCPGDDRGGGRPNWVVSLETPEYVNLLRWQWRERVLPYWKEAARLARQHGRRVGLEFDPGYSVFNVNSLLRLRAATNENIGCNLDLSNMFAQGIEADAAIRALTQAGALFHFHAKDALLDQANIAVNGVLDTTPYDQVERRSWSYAAVGYGHDVLYWKRALAALKAGGYDYVLSIEHEDPLTAPEVGVRLSAEFLQGILLR